MTSSEPEQSTSTEDEEEGEMTNAYSVSDLLGELDGHNGSQTELSQSEQKTNNNTPVKESTIRPVEGKKDQSGAAEDDGNGNDGKVEKVGFVSNEGDFKTTVDNTVYGKSEVILTEPAESQAVVEEPCESDPTPIVNTGEDLHHSPQDVRQMERESLGKGLCVTSKVEEHIYYNVPPGTGHQSTQNVQDIREPLQGTGAKILDRNENIGKTDSLEHQYDSVVNENYQDPLYNEVPAEDLNHGEHQSIDKQPDIYENLHQRETLSSEGGDDDWGSEEFDEFEESYQSNVSSKEAKSKGPPTLPARNQSEAPKTSSDTPLPPTPTSSIFDKFAAFKLGHRSSKHSEGEEEESPMMEVTLDPRKHPAPELPPQPDGLEPLWVKRRHIVSSIIASERSYTASLNTLVEDYEKPLLNAKPEVISRKAIKLIFFKVRDILQCHNMFHIELSECVKVWDKEQSIGNIFTASFSKSIVFEAYSAFVNNFSLAMETAKKQARTKQAFAEFLKNKISNSLDKLSLFGLMVKPVQRFPQFIMLLQDLLKQTPQTHHDRLPLQMALTELENLTHKLNETKRVSESRHEVRRIMANLTGRFSLKPDKDHFLVRQDDLLQIDQTNEDTKTKARRLLLLNDHLICVTVMNKDSEGGSPEAKFKFKWAVPITEVELVESSIQAPYQVKIGHGKTTVTAVRNIEKSPGGESSAHPYKKELDDMLHDLPVIEHVGQLVGQLRLRYEGITPECLNGLIKTLQLMIQQKCDVDRCIIRFSIPGKGSSRVNFTFQTDAPGIKHDWMLELQNTKLALDPKNKPGWYVPENEMMCTFKLPLFIKPLLIDITKQETKVQCAIPVLLPSDTPGYGIQHLWVCSGTEGKGQVTIVSLHTNQPHAVESFPTCDAVVTCCDTVPGLSHCDDPNAFHEDTVWMGTEDNRIIIYRVTEEQRSENPLQIVSVENSVTCLKYLDNHIYVGLRNGILLVFARNQDGVWGVEDKEMLYLGDLPVTCLLQVRQQIWACSDCKVHLTTITIHPMTDSPYREDVTLVSHELSTSKEDVIQCMVTAGVGLLVSFKNKSVIRLYHLETFEHLQDVSVSSNIARVLEGTDLDFTVVSISSLLASRGLLWIGTNIGVVLTLPLPRLEGVPQVKSRPNVSYHAHTGPIKFLTPIQCGVLPLPHPPISAAAQYEASEHSCGNTVLESGAYDRHIPEADEGLDPERFTQSCEPSFSELQPLGSNSFNGMAKCTSTPDLRLMELYENQDVEALYGDLMRVDNDYEQEIMGPRRRRAPHLNIGKQVSKLSDAVSSKISSSNQANPKFSTLPILHEDSSHIYESYEFKGSGSVNKAAQDPIEDNKTVETDSIQSGSSQSVCTSESPDMASLTAPVRVSPRGVLPTYQGVHSYHMHSKACIIVSGGEGHVNWSDKKAADSRYEDICMILWNCRL